MKNYLKQLGKDVVSNLILGASIALGIGLGIKLISLMF